MPIDPFKQKLRPVNPLERRLPADDPALGFNQTPEQIAEAGYKVLDRADSQNPFTPQRRGLSEPVFDFPQPDPY